MIIFDQVSKTYPTGDLVLDSVSFIIEPQEFVIIEGPSGSGKTTLFRLIYKDLEPSQGTITVDGEDIAKIKPSAVAVYRRKIGFAFQDFKIIPDKTVWENLALPLEILNFKDDLIKTRLDHLLDLTGLTAKAMLFPRQLSGGELQRVAIARAIASEPVILLADEPTGNLDVDTSKQIIKLLQEINKLGTTVILASHDHEAISGLIAHRLYLKEGKLEDKPLKTTKDDATTPKEEEEKK